MYASTTSCSAKREDQRHVDVRPAAIESSIAPTPGCPGDLDDRFGLSIFSCSCLPARRRLAVVREVRVDLHRDVTVRPGALLPDAAQEVTRVANVLLGEAEERVDTSRNSPPWSSRSCSSYALPCEIAFWKMVGFEVVPSAASSRIIRSSSPLVDQVPRQVVDPDALSPLTVRATDCLRCISSIRPSPGPLTAAPHHGGTRRRHGPLLHTLLCPRRRLRPGAARQPAASDEFLPRGTP